jgi:hypothetical protein
MSVRRLLSEMDSRELTAWMAYESVEPFGERRANLHAGIVAATVANVNRDKHTRAFLPTDFLLEFGRERESGDDEAQMQAMRAQMALIAQVQNAVSDDQADSETGDANAGGAAAQAD